MLSFAGLLSAQGRWDNGKKQTPFHGWKDLGADGTGRACFLKTTPSICAAVTQIGKALHVNLKLETRRPGTFFCAPHGNDKKKQNDNKIRGSSMGVLRLPDQLVTAFVRSSTVYVNEELI